MSFVVVFALLLFGVIFLVPHLYLWKRLARDTGLSRAAQQRCFVLALVLTVLVEFRFVLSPRGTTPDAQAFVWWSSVWMGVLLLLVTWFVLTDVLLLLARLARRAPFPEERRGFLKRVVAGTGGVGTTLLSGVGIANARFPIATNTVPIVLQKLSSQARPYTLVQVSDVHVGANIGREAVAALVAQCNALDADAIVVTGDLIDGAFDEIREELEPLRALRARDGVFFVTGNHEFYWGATQWIAHLRTLGLRVLRNERVSLGGEHGFELVGIEDWSSGKFRNEPPMDLDGALRGRDRTRPVVLLAHQPRVADLAERAGVDLMLSGHTHGGQLFPLRPFVRLLHQPYVDGLHRQGNLQVYVSRGAGFAFAPMRLGAPAEITKFVLLAPGASSPSTAAAPKTA